MKTIEHTVLEDNGKIRLIQVNDHCEAEEFFENSLREPNLYPTIVVAPWHMGNPDNPEVREILERKKKSLQFFSIDFYIDTALKVFRSGINNHRDFKSKMRQNGISQFDYATAYFEHGVEGQCSVSERDKSNQTYISPRFMRVSCYPSTQSTVMPGPYLTENKSECINVCGLPQRLGWEITNNEKTWLMARFLTDKVYKNFNISGRPNKQQQQSIQDRVIFDIVNNEGVVMLGDINNFEHIHKDYIQGLTIDEFRARVIQDIRDYSGFLERAYSETEKFVRAVEQYKTNP